MIVIDDTFSYELKDDYIHFFLKGEQNYEISVSWWNDIASIASRLKYKKVLVETSIFGKLSSLEVLEVVNEFEQIGLKGIKIAYLEANLDQKSLNEYGSMIAKLSDIDANVFVDKEEALTWLKYRTPKRAVH